MSTLGQLETKDGVNEAAKKAAEYYVKGIKEWKKTSMNNDVKSVDDIIKKFKRPIENTHAEVTLQDAEKH